MAPALQSLLAPVAIFASINLVLFVLVRLEDTLPLRSARRAASQPSREARQSPVG